MKLWEQLEQWIWRRREARAKRWLANSPLRTRRRAAPIRIDGDPPRVRWPRQAAMDRWCYQEDRDPWRRECQLPDWQRKEVEHV